MRFAVGIVRVRGIITKEAAMLVTLIVVLLIVALALYAVQLLPVDGRLTLILQLAIIILAIVYLAEFVH